MAVLSARYLQDLADRRAAEASALLQLGHFSGAYYLAAYALECGLKALIASRFEAGIIPDKKLVQQIYTHKLSQLLELSGLEGERQELADRESVRLEGALYRIRPCCGGARAGEGGGLNAWAAHSSGKAQVAV